MDKPAVASVADDSGHFHLQFGGTPHGQYAVKSQVGAPWDSFYAVPTVEVFGAEVRLSEQAPPEWRDELKRSAVTAIREAELPRTAISSDFARECELFVPMITDADHNAFAAIFRPPHGALEVIYLPERCVPSRAWITLAFERWAVQRPDTFPAKVDWTTSPVWMSPSELAKSDLLSKAKHELQAETARLEKALAGAEADLESERSKADAADRLILTGTGDDLVGAVANLLRELGFEVEDRDATGQPEKLEDLRVRTADFVAIAEVKGYTKGGSSSDLMKLYRFVKLFVKETGDFPSAQWYIVNQFRNSDPGTRPQLLVNQDSTVEEFGKDDGLAIDTRSLFRLRRDVSDGKIGREDASAMLIQARGRFIYPGECSE
ncbi:hypothetical protein [Mycolicibacterium lutetiense]